MTADHAARAVELTEQAMNPTEGVTIRHIAVASAQVHATLALAEAVGRSTVQRPRWDDDLRETPWHDYEPREPEPASGPPAPSDRVEVPDYYGDGVLAIAWRPDVPYAPLTLSTHGHWSIDMTLARLLAAIADAGGPDLRPDHPEIVTERGQERGKSPGEYLCDVCSTYVDGPSDVRHDRAVHGDAS